MSSHALLKRNPNPSEEEIRHALEGNLCRCTGYQNIVRAVQHAAAAMGGGPMPDTVVDWKSKLAGKST